MKYVTRKACGLTWHIYLLCACNRRKVYQAACGMPAKSYAQRAKALCDVMGQNQSHVAKHKMAEICIFSENVKICPFFVFIKNKIFV